MRDVNPATQACPIPDQLALWTASASNVVVGTSTSVAGVGHQLTHQPAALLPAAVPFPLEALPKVIAQYVSSVAAALPCPVDLPAVAALAAAATAIGNSTQLEVKVGWVEGPRLWSAIVCEPGSKKSPALAAATAPLREAQRRHQREYQIAAAKHPSDRADPPRLPYRCPGGTGAEPVMRQLYTADTTREALTDLLAANPRGLALIADELAGWTMALNQYKRGKGDDRQFWLALWGGSDILVNRAKTKGRPTAYVTDPMLTVVGCLPPAALGQLQDEARREDGFLHRLLFSWPERCAYGWTDAEPDPTARQAYEELFARLLALELPTDPLTGAVRPRRLHWSDDGKRAWVAYMNQLTSELNNLAHPEVLRGPWAKLEGYGARLALVVHVCRQVSGETANVDVDGPSMEKAAQLVRYFQAHARRVYGQLAGKPDTTGADCQAVLDWVGRHRGELQAAGDWFRWHQLRRDLHNRFAGRETDLRATLLALMHRGYLRELPQPRPPRGRPPAPAYQLAVEL
ncbi:hypothetical protein AYO44_01460 [Planctomycetaceae bacterium SCGC AG-212-F19]|nr:hypothetical protein AYO44_01460 [Planctomycetaceae bacterium SCGC AG-212-F19]